jgi:hypothetical protein
MNKEGKAMVSHPHRGTAHQGGHDGLRTIHDYRFLTAGKLAADDRRNRAIAEGARWRALEEARPSVWGDGAISAVLRVARAGLTRVGLPRRAWVCGADTAPATTSRPSTG